VLICFLIREPDTSLHCQTMDSGVVHCTVCLFTSQLLSILIAPIHEGNKILEIWGKAQRESARRPKSNWGKLEGGGKISPASKSRGPNSNALAYTEHALST